LKSERRFDKIINQSWVVELDLGDNPAERTISEKDELILDYEKFMAEIKAEEEAEKDEEEEEDDGYGEESDESNFYHNGQPPMMDRIPITSVFLCDLHFCSLAMFMFREAVIFRLI
jgi:hypothetical protein